MITFSQLPPEWQREHLNIFQSTCVEQGWIEQEHIDKVWHWNYIRDQVEITMPILFNNHLLWANVVVKDFSKAPLWDALLTTAKNNVIDKYLDGI